MKGIKKFGALVMAGTLAVGMTACGSSSSKSTSTKTNSTKKEASDMKVAMITDYGDITDQSFNQTTYEACKTFANDNGIDFTYKKPSGDSTAERGAMIDKAIAEGYNVIVMPGYAFAGAIVEKSGMYKDTKFVALDVSEYDLTDYAKKNNKEFYKDNVYSAVYQEELPGYMAGYAAVKMGYKNIGFLGGMAVPAVQRYGYGFVQGADAAAAEIGATDVNCKYVYAGGFAPTPDIKAAMDTWFQNGTQIVFSCGGGIFNSACDAASAAKGKIIGVDVDQKATIDGKYGDGLCVTSAMKGLGATVNTLLSDIKDGKWSKHAGKIETLGLVSGTDMSKNYVGLPEESTAFNDTFKKSDYEGLVAKMVSGEVKVSNDTSAEKPAVKNITLDFQGNLK